MKSRHHITSSHSEASHHRAQVRLSAVSKFEKDADRVNCGRFKLISAYQELGKELSSRKIRVVGNYTLGKVIGEGTYGKVRMGTHRLTQSRVAIKQIPKEMSPQLTREIHHHRRLHHPNVVQLYEVIATETSIWLVTELCSGGELFDYLAEKGRISEPETRRIFGQLCLAMHYVHGSGAVHRDIKLENVLLDDRVNIKISDFGFTREYEQGRLLDTFCGTTGYAAPEMLRGEKYMGPEVDIWSLGIILHCLLTGSLPFDDDDEDIMKAKIISSEYDDPTDISKEGVSLIRSILRKKPSDRIRIPKILAHPWFSAVESTYNDPKEAAGTATPAHIPLSSSVDTISEEDAASSTTFEEAKNYAAHTISEDELLTSVKIAEEVLKGRPLEWSSGSIVSLSDYSSSASDVVRSTSEGRASTEMTSVTTPELPATSLGETDGDEDVEDIAQMSVTRMSSQSTIVKGKAGVIHTSSKLSLASKRSDPSLSLIDTVPEEDMKSDQVARPPLSRNNSLKSKNPPSSYPRTPVRTKRRSVHSLNLSPPSSPIDLPDTPENAGAAGSADYAQLLTVNAPIMFSTALERDLLNNLSFIGFDTGQIVHSVLTDACDSTGALWWILKKKAEKREMVEARRVMQERKKALAALGDSVKPRASASPPALTESGSTSTGNHGNASLGSSEEARASFDVARTQDDSLSRGVLGPSPLMLQLIAASASDTQILTDSVNPPGITFAPPTPKRSRDGYAASKPVNSSSLSLGAEFEDSGQPLMSSNTSTPKGKARDGKPRSSSVSMLQRAAGALTRKKSEEKVRERDLRDRSSSSATNPNKSSSSLVMPRHSEATSSTASPKLLAASINTAPRPSPSQIPSSSTFTDQAPPTPPPSKSRGNEASTSKKIGSYLTPGSPWTSVEGSPSAVKLERTTSTNTPPAKPVFRFMQSSTSVQSEETTIRGGNPLLNESSTSSKVRGPRGSILNAFKTWFHDDREKKRTREKLKSPRSAAAAAQQVSASPVTLRPRSSVNARQASRYHRKRPSVSSRRSSSIASRRSSINSLHKRPTDFSLSLIPSTPTESIHRIARSSSRASRQSNGHRTPTSDLGFGLSSRPSSVSSIHNVKSQSSARPIRPSSPSQSSLASSKRARQSPMHGQASHYHRRIGSGSSSRVVRQHHRNSSQASSSPSSRPPSIDLAAAEDAMLSSPTPTKSNHFVFANKSHLGFGTPSASRATASRYSWRKSWGMEPPGWKSRITHDTSRENGNGFSNNPIILNADENSFRDVFTGRQSLDPEDDSDWVDEDEDTPAYVGGLGQLPALVIPSSIVSDTKSRSKNGASILPPSPSLALKRELPPLPSAQRVSARSTGPLFATASASFKSSVGKLNTRSSSANPPSLIPVASSPSSASLNSQSTTSGKKLDSKLTSHGGNLSKKSDSKMGRSSSAVRGSGNAGSKLLASVDEDAESPTNSGGENGGHLASNLQNRGGRRPPAPSTRAEDLQAQTIQEEEEEDDDS